MNQPSLLHWASARAEEAAEEAGDVEELERLQRARWARAADLARTWFAERAAERAHCAAGHCAGRTEDDALCMRKGVHDDVTDLRWCAQHKDQA